MWNGIEIRGNSTSLIDQLTSQGIGAAIMPITLPREAVVLTFPEECLGAVFETLSIQKTDIIGEWATDLPEVVLLGLNRDVEYEVTLIASEDRQNSKFVPKELQNAITEALGKVAYKIKKNIKVDVYHGDEVPSGFADNTINIVVFASDIPREIVLYEKIAGIALARPQKVGCKLSGVGIPIVFSEDEQPIVMVCGTTVYVPFDLFHCPENVVEIITKIAEKVGEITFDKEKFLAEAYERNMKGVAAYLTKFMDHEKNFIATEITKVETNLISLQEKMTSSYREIDSLKLKLQGLSTRDTAQFVDKAMNEVRKLKEIMFVELSPSGFVLITAPVIHNFEGKSYYLSSFRVDISLAGKITFKRNVEDKFAAYPYPENPHPHIRTNGETVCYGGWGDMVAQNTASYEIGGLANILVQFLWGYNHGDSYASLAEWPVISCETYDKCGKENCENCYSRKRCKVEECKGKTIEGYTANIPSRE